MNAAGPPARPTDESYAQLGFRPQRATRWLAPRQYVRTTLRTMLAEVLGSFTDRRETLASLDPRPGPDPDLDRSGADELWIDYLADTGDGFAHTLPVAWAVAHDELEVDGCPDPLPARFAVAAATLACTIALARRPTPVRALPWAIPHAAAHVGCMASALAVADALGDDASLWWSAAVLLVAGGLLAPVIVGLYFLVVGTVAGINDNEAFAGIRVRQHKHFLRLHIDRAGAMRLYVIGIEDAPPRREWHLQPDGAPGDPWFATSSPPRVRLLDGPVELGSGVTPVTRGG